MAKIVLSVPGKQNLLLVTPGALASVSGAADDHTVAAIRPPSPEFGGARATFSFIDRDGTATVLAASGNETLFPTAAVSELHQAGFGTADMMYAAGGNATLGGAVAFETDMFNTGPGHDRVAGGSGGGTFLVRGGHVALQGGLDQTFSAVGESQAEYALSSTRISHGSTTLIMSDNTHFTFSGFGEADKSPLA